MFLPIKGGSKVIVGEGYQCWLPPKPNNELILYNNLPREEQYWRREPLPDFYMERSFEEEEKGTLDTILERFRRREWHRRRWGVWFYNDGIPTYITGHHYWYLQWCKFDHKENDGYPFYYEFSRDAFYFRQQAEENPLSLGYMVIGPRGTGKSNEELACITNNATFYHNLRCALQSKHFEEDSKAVLIQAKTVPLFNALPKFFKPEFAHGTNPQGELILRRASVKGKASKEMEFGPDLELNSTIFAAMPGEKALDKDTIGELMEDEIGKTDPKKVSNIHTRHGVNVKCVFRNHRKIGLLRKTSTVEEMEEGGDQCYKLWKDSDPKKRDRSGWTISQIDRFLISALDTDTSLQDYIDYFTKQNYGPPCDKHGRVKRDIANIKIQNSLDAVAHDLKERSSRMRKSPRNASEAFIKDQSKSIFNVQRLSDRLEYIRNTMKKPPYVRGNLYWLNDKKGGPVGFKIDEHAGRFYWAWFPDEFTKGDKHPDKWKILNNFGKVMDYDVQGNYREMTVPKNDLRFAIGTDPIKYSKTKDPRASKASMHGFRKFDINVDLHKPKAQWETHNFIFEYIERPEDPNTYFEDVGMACHFLGCSVLPESNIKSLVQYFEREGWEKFLRYPEDFDEMKVTKQDDAGFSSTPEVIDSYTRRLITFINEHCHRMPFDRTIESWLNFNPADTTTYDATVSSGFTLVATEAKVDSEDEDPQELDDWFDMYDNTGPVSRMVELREEFPRQDKQVA